MTIAFELDGQTFTALNGGLQFKFNEAMSLQVVCENQEEVDHYWQRLTEGEIREPSNAGGSRTGLGCPGRSSRNA